MNTYDWKKRPVSWSFLSSFEYSPEQWYNHYVLCMPTRETSEMRFGSTIGKKLETDPTFLPQIQRHSKMEHPFENIKFGKFMLVGYADTFCDITFKKLDEFKTGKRAWDQKRVDDHGQLTMYCLMNWIKNKIKPEDVEINLWWMPTQDNGDFSISFVEPIEKNIKVFSTKRTMMDVLRFGMRIRKVYAEMEKYVEKRQKEEANYPHVR